MSTQVCRLTVRARSFHCNEQYCSASHFVQPISRMGQSSRILVAQPTRWSCKTPSGAQCFCYPEWLVLAHAFRVLSTALPQICVCVTHTTAALVRSISEGFTTLALLLLLLTRNIGLSICSLKKSDKHSPNLRTKHYLQELTISF